MNKETFIDNDKTILNTDFYLYLLSRENENTNLKKSLNEIREYVNGAYEMSIYTKSVSLDEENIEDILQIIDKVLGDEKIMTKKTLEKTFYLIAWYEMGQLRGFVKIGDDKEEITKLFEDRYMWKPNTMGVTEYSYQLLECNATEIMNDREYIDKVLGDEK